MLRPADLQVCTDNDTRCLDAAALREAIVDQMARRGNEGMGWSLAVSLDVADPARTAADDPDISQ